jgi:hypothetical protein
MGDPNWCLKRAVTRQTRRPALLRRVSRHNPAAIQTSLDGAPRSRNRVDLREKKAHREDLMNADMLSEILLLVCGSAFFVALLLILVAALTQTAALT